MKQLFILLAASLLLVCCKQPIPKGETVVTSVITDITDTNRITPEMVTIRPLLGLEKSKQNKSVFRLLPITDRQLNPQITIVLEEERVTEKENSHNNPLYRNRLIANYYHRVEKAVDDFVQKRKQSNSALGHSEVFGTLAKEFQTIKAYNAKKATILLYSDLMDNSELLSVYRLGNISQKEATLIEKKFESTGMLPQNLSGITIVVVYNPATRKEDIHFMSIAGIYEKLLKKRGANFIISATNQINVYEQ